MSGFIYFWGKASYRYLRSENKFFLVLPTYQKVNHMNTPSEKLAQRPLITKGTWSPAIREAKFYISKIYRFFHLDEVRLDSEEEKINLSEAKNLENNLLTPRCVLESYRIGNKTKFGLFLNSSAIMIYSAFELSLYNVAQDVADSLGKREDLKNYKNNSKNKKFSGYIGKFALYLIETLSLDWEDLSETWKDINDFRSIRNTLIHNGGIITETNKKAFDEIAQRSFGLSRERDLIKIELIYLDQITDIIIYFFDSLCEKINTQAPTRL